MINWDFKYKGNFDFLFNSSICSDFSHELVNAECNYDREPAKAVYSMVIALNKIIDKLYSVLSIKYEGKSLNEKLYYPEFMKIVNKAIFTKMEEILKFSEFIFDMDEDEFEDDVYYILENSYIIAYWFCASLNIRNDFIYEPFKAPHYCIFRFCEPLENYSKNECLQIENRRDFKISNNLVSETMGLLKDNINLELQDFFGSMTNSQERAINEIGKFLDNPSQKVHLLQGYSGTGKTHLTKGLTNYLDKIEKNYILIAPTGKAARVIQNKTNKEAQTIHKCIYELKYLKDEKDSYQMYFHHDEGITRPSNTIFIVDEASMISDNYSSQEYFRFGSGKLLSDLIEFTNIYDEKFNNQILFIGDSMQLPPVGMQTSPALSKDYLEKTFNLSIHSSELTDVVRQKKESGILKNATMIREYIQSSNKDFIKLDFSYDDIQQIEQSQVVNKYLSQANGSSIIIAYSNKTVDTYNDKIREQLFPFQKFITKGDVVMAIANNSKLPIEVNNGDHGKIVNVAPNSEIRNVRISKKINEEEIIVTVPLVFKIVEVDFSDVNQKSCSFEALIFENILYRSLIYKNTEFEHIINKHGLSDSDIERIEKQALYVDVVTRAKNIGIEPNSKEFQKFIFEDSYFNSLKIKFGYAITCHKAQGSEWENVYLDAKTFISTASKDYLRWLYTAITRSSKSLYLINHSVDK